MRGQWRPALEGRLVLNAISNLALIPSIDMLTQCGNQTKTTLAHSAPNPSSRPSPFPHPCPCRRRTSSTRSWRRSSSAYPPRPRSHAPRPPPPVSAASSPSGPSSAASASAIRRRSSDSRTEKAFTQPRRPTPPPRSPVPSPTPPISPIPSSPSPARGGWMPSDVRDGSVLLEEDSPGWKKFSNLAVCDPLSRRHRLLPPVPEELTGARKEHPCEIMPILAPISEEDEDETSFKVICMANYETELVAFVFSSLTEQWCIAASASWSSLGTVRPCGSRMLSFYYGCRGFSSLDYVRGCFYWASPWMDKLILLNTQRMEFSIVNDHTGYHLHLRCQADEVLARNDMPYRNRPGQIGSLPRIVVGREGAIEMFSLVGDHIPHGSFNLYHTTQQNDCESSKGWQLENIIPLPSQYDYFTLGAAEGFLFLGATIEDQLYIDDHSPVWLSKTDWDVDYFSLDVKTSELAKVCRRKRQFFHSEHVYWYFGFPPSLSKPSI